MTPTPGVIRQSMLFGAVLLAVLVVSVIALGVTSGVLWGLRSNDVQKLASTEETLRYWQGKALKSEDEREEEITRIRGEFSVTEWKLQGELDACHKGGKP